ncbi:hypothetical protein AB4Z45_19325 [Paenibacillus sp. MCAF9]|uniref:hypothetical protein n=1 Tax=Paenibacillus sp. MCAF9 TaxID=3233046 RepID=UPI003F954567
MGNDQLKMEWVKVGGTESGNNITRDVNHFTKYAIFAVAESATRQQWTSSLSPHNGEACIKQAASVVRCWNKSTKNNLFEESNQHPCHGLTSYRWE